MEQCRQRSKKWQCRNEMSPLPCRGVVMWVPVGCWRHRVWRRRTWCGELWWAATCVVIINGTNPENGQQHAAWWRLLTTAWLLVARVKHTHTQITPKIIWNKQSLLRNVCVCIGWPIIYTIFYHLIPPCRRARYDTGADCHLLAK